MPSEKITTRSCPCVVKLSPVCVCLGGPISGSYGKIMFDRDDQGLEFTFGTIGWCPLSNRRCPCLVDATICGIFQSLEMWPCWCFSSGIFLVDYEVAKKLLLTTDGWLPLLMVDLFFFPLLMVDFPLSPSFQNSNSRSLTPWHQAIPVETDDEVSTPGTSEVSRWEIGQFSDVSLAQQMHCMAIFLDTQDLYGDFCWELETFLTQDISGHCKY